MRACRLNCQSLHVNCAWAYSALNTDRQGAVAQVWCKGRIGDRAGEVAKMCAEVMDFGRLILEEVTVLRQRDKLSYSVFFFAQAFVMWMFLDAEALQNNKLRKIMHNCGAKFMFAEFYRLFGYACNKRG